MGIIPFLKQNPLVFTFEVGDLYRKMVEELDEDNMFPPLPPTRDLDPALDVYTGDLGHDDWINDVLDDQFDEMIYDQYMHAMPMGPHTRRFLRHVRFNTWIQPAITRANNRLQPDGYAREFERIFGKPVPDVLDFDNTPQNSQTGLADPPGGGVDGEALLPVHGPDENGSQADNAAPAASIASGHEIPVHMHDIDDMYE